MFSLAYLYLNAYAYKTYEFIWKLAYWIRFNEQDQLAERRSNDGSMIKITRQVSK